MLSAGRELAHLVAALAPELGRAAAPLWRADGLRERYRHYLMTMHAVLRASVPLMVVAAEQAGPDPRLRAYLERHIAEEHGHDTWLLADLQVLGVPSARVRLDPPTAVVARLVGPQYYWIHHYSPLCLLGYIAVLESNAPAAELADRLPAATGYPPAAFRTIVHHAAVDAEHAAAVFDLLDVLAPAEPLRRAIRTSALHTVAALGDLFRAIDADPMTRSVA